MGLTPVGRTQIFPEQKLLQHFFFYPHSSRDTESTEKPRLLFKNPHPSVTFGNTFSHKGVKFQKKVEIKSTQKALQKAFKPYVTVNVFP